MAHLDTKGIFFNFLAHDRYILCAFGGLDKTAVELYGGRALCDRNFAKFHGSATAFCIIVVGV